MLQDRKNRGGLVAAQAAPLARRGIPQALLEMRHFGPGHDLVAAGLDCVGKSRRNGTEQGNEDVASVGSSGAR